ncbi:esterase-like activity of phytase family protein [Sphingomonas sp. KRR8]|uniref:esterase-like activity of phytase family protein n=1 Tax=Sphingomonas sp. KRR8 TaxID=2942996 RepID=UPI0020201F24|nr:esterase-like activity of phytase family protein [Sphingomonas sp. KRR8]URD60016.1 esterase-like activity of phytase family protein [Sphingomonas sp. KRR8]
MRRRILLVLTAAAIAVLPGDGGQELPNRKPLPDAVAAVRFTPLRLKAGPALGPVRLLGAWTVTSPDRRFFGLSALSVTNTGLLAQNDSGVVIRLPRPGMAASASLHDLPAGPGYATFKKYRDSEGLLRAADGGWFVTFEYRDSLWHFDRDFRRGQRVVDLRAMHWPRNEGVEALVGAPRGGLLLLPETRRGALLLRGGKATLLPLAGRTGGLSDAVTLPDGRIVVAVRELGLGITNRLAWLKPDGLGYRLEPFATLPLGWLDNVEGLAAEPMAGGGTRLWAVTDNDGWRRTVLLEMILPPAPRAATR